MTNEELALRIAAIADCAIAQRIVILHLLNEQRPEPRADAGQLLRNCECGHRLDAHTFSVERVGCDECKCRRSILDTITARLIA